LIVYVGVTWRSLLEASAPALACHQPSTGASPFSSLNCFRPAIRVGDQFTIQLQLFLRPPPSTENGDVVMEQSTSRRAKYFPRWVPVDTCRIDLVVPVTGKLPKLVTSVSDSKVGGALEKGDRNVTKYDTSKQCEVILPAIARHRSKIQSEVQPLKARFVLLETTPTDEVDEADDDTNQTRRYTSVIGTMTPFFLTRVQKREPKSMMRFLLESGSTTIRTTPSNQDSTSSGTNISILERNDSDNSYSDQQINSTTWIPYLKFGRSPIRIRFVAEDRGYALLNRADGIGLQALNSSFYAPMVYVDELSLQQSAQIELAPFEDNKPPVKLQIKFGSISPMVDTLYRQVQMTFEIIEDNIFVGPESDELKYFLQDENLFRFALTNIISTFHVWFDYLAFRDEVKFYRGRQNLSGVSPSTVISRMVCSLIILLYLIDGGGTSWVVLFSLFSSFVVEVWKVFKLLRPNITSKFPFVTIRQQKSKQELKTTEYDRIACRRLSVLIYPVLFCWSVYALKTYEYRSVYSWFISNLANGVYTFGFISMCPQLYVNYRLKSVAHLPWKVFIYKIFNTFVDDAFAWIIEMPLKHRLMTLRDDFVFLIFLVQVYLYRVDKSRSNEFGYTYDDEDGEGKLLTDEMTLSDNSVSDCCTNENESATSTNNIEKLKTE
jgi:hypothetical protein